MNNTGQNGEKMRYRVVLLLVVALAAFSSAMKELNQAQQLALDASALISGWSNKVAPNPTEVQPAVVKAETCEMKQSAPAVDLPWLTESEPVEIERAARPAITITRRAHASTVQTMTFRRLHLFNIDPVQFIRISPRDREMLFKLNRSINLRIAS
jgi:hypothetical protein